MDKQWKQYFVTKIVLTYCEKKIVLAIESSDRFDLVMESSDGIQ